MHQLEQQARKASCPVLPCNCLEVRAASSCTRSTEPWPGSMPAAGACIPWGRWQGNSKGRNLSCGSSALAPSLPSVPKMHVHPLPARRQARTLWTPVQLLATSLLPAMSSLSPMVGGRGLPRALASSGRWPGGCKWLHQGSGSPGLAHCWQRVHTCLGVHDGTALPQEGLGPSWLPCCFPAIAGTSLPSSTLLLPCLSPVCPAPFGAPHCFPSPHCPTGLLPALL